MHVDDVQDQSTARNRSPNRIETSKEKSNESHKQRNCSGNEVHDVRFIALGTFKGTEKCNGVRVYLHLNEAMLDLVCHSRRNVHEGSCFR